jgi:phosphatidyl-myo-inositol alpha-mannosyltransferase
VNIAMYHCRLPSPGRKPGGAEVYVDRLATALSRRGHRVTVWTYAAPAVAPAYNVRALRPARLADHKLLRQYVGPWQLNAVNWGDNEVVHLFGDDWFYFRRTRPTVRTFLGSAAFESTSATSRRRRIDQWVLFGLEQISARLATVSYGIGIESELLYRGAGSLPSGIELWATEDSRPAPAPTILFVGTWEGRKRGAFLHEVFLREVRTRVPNARLWMVSDKARETEGVSWFAHPTDAELHDLYARAWVFCLPSRYEGFGLPYLEAAARGLAVVSTPNTGALAMLGMSSDGDGAGVVVADAELGAVLVRLLEDGPLRESLGRRARDRAADFSWDRVVALHERAYETAMQRAS